MEQKIQNDKKEDYSNKTQLRILLTVILLIALLLILYINYRPQIKRLEEVPVAMQNMLLADVKRDSTLTGIYNLVMDLKVQLNHFPSAPLKIEDMTKVSSTYNIRTDPRTGLRTFHSGIDYRVKKGTILYASAAGVVIEARWDGGYGNTVKIDHLYGYITSCSHMDSIKVQVGQLVNKGDEIGTAGNTGWSTGPHVHFETAFRDSTGIRKLNPQYFINTVTDSTYGVITR